MLATYQTAPEILRNLADHSLLDEDVIEKSPRCSRRRPGIKWVNSKGDGEISPEAVFSNSTRQESTAIRRQTCVPTCVHVVGAGLLGSRVNALRKS